MDHSQWLDKGQKKLTHNEPQSKQEYIILFIYSCTWDSGTDLPEHLQNWTRIGTAKCLFFPVIGGHGSTEAWDFFGGLGSR